MPRNVARWFHEAEDGHRAPYHVERWLASERRRDTAREAGAVSALDHARELCADELDERIPDWNARRDAEQRLAHRMLRLPALLPADPIRRQAEKMLVCRTDGFYARQDGELRVAWADKCGSTRLCPDEARAETQRLSERYVPEILRWLNAAPWRDAHYAVFTAPNFPRGQLEQGKRALMSRQRDFIKTLCKQKSIAGALVVQEDPLASRGDWNVHNNVILLCEGWLDYAMVRERWGHNVHLQRIDPAEKSLRRSMLELVKYAAQHVPEKSEAKKGDDWLFPEFKKAPALVEWDDDALREWLAVQLGEAGARRRAPFRRVRSYGCLYRLDALRWSDATYDGRREWASAARQFDRGPPLFSVHRCARCRSWYSLDKRIGEGMRDAIREVWDAIDGTDDGPKGEPVWLGVLRFAPGVGYCVGSIEGDNFFGLGGMLSGAGQTGPPFS